MAGTSGNSFNGSYRIQPPTPQETIRGQLNKGWGLLSEHLSRDYDEVLMWDRLHCLETTIAHALATRSTLLPNCLPLLQEVKHDIHTCVQLTSAQSHTTACYMVLGTYAVLATHTNNQTKQMINDLHTFCEKHI